MSAHSLNSRCYDYLCNGGLFNPEMMDHDKVRDLIMDLMRGITESEIQIEALLAMSHKYLNVPELREYERNRELTLEPST